MTTRSQREFLKVQLLETERLHAMAADHPLMGPAFAQRKNELKELVNPVDTVGVMGKGLALAFKKRFSEKFPVVSPRMRDG